MTTENDPPPEQKQGQIQGYQEQMSKTIAALQKPTSFLLFILMVILTIEVANYLEYQERSVIMRDFLLEVEGNRSAEMREAGETIRELSRRLERAKSLTPSVVEDGRLIPPVTIEGVGP